MAGYGLVEAVSPEIYRKALFGFVTAPLEVGAAFVRACRPGFESGLVMVSAGAAAACLEGCSAYGAGKIAMEHWAQVVDQELGRKPGKPWVVAVRPGGVLSAGVQRLVESKDDASPNVAHVRANAHRRLTPARAAGEIWKALPPPPGVSLITLANLPYPELQFEGRRAEQVEVPGWQLVYR
jgi:benzil reductase ((S)-benzoin forming)